MGGLTQFLTKLFEGLHENLISVFNMEPSGASYVLTITVFTVIIKLLILPLNIKANKSNAKMQDIQPELNEIKKKHANNPQKMQEESNRVMKENNVSMFGGCLPSLLPLPILFALYGVFNKVGPELVTNPSFLWIPNVFEKDPRYILPVLAFLSTYVPSLLLSKSTKVNPDGPNMGSMNLMMGGMMGFMAINFKSLLVVYWVIGGAIQLIQTYFINYIPFKKKQELEKKENKYVYNVDNKGKKTAPKGKKQN
ncbi:membrane protein insertase YidC [Clostridium sp.]|uniref:membrane protein insertase YidC n=1 Tax=Clostridium sp. TaxID=1506 RepID=UPI00261CE1CF|nr:membrane protein insertase YidC [Clostridium sp.]